MSSLSIIVTYQPRRKISPWRCFHQVAFSKSICVPDFPIAGELDFIRFNKIASTNFVWGKILVSLTNDFTRTIPLIEFDSVCTLYPMKPLSSCSPRPTRASRAAVSSDLAVSVAPVNTSPTIFSCKATAVFIYPFTPSHCLIVSVGLRRKLPYGGSEPHVSLF